MKAVSAEELKHVIELQHGGTAKLIRSVRVHDPRGKPADWDGIVHVFDLKGQPEARRAYAWVSPIAGTASPRYFAVLHTGKVTGPVEAVKAAAAAIRKWGSRGARA